MACPPPPAIATTFMKKALAPKRPVVPEKYFISSISYAKKRNEQVVHFCDFIDYFRDLSAAIENDEYFQAVALNAWVLPADNDRGGGCDGANNTDSCRALVTHPDGVQEVRWRNR